MPFVDPLPLIITYLGVELAPVRVAARKPDPMPPRLVQVRRVGGPALPPVRDQVRVDAFAWAATDEDAMDLALQVRSALWDLAGTYILGVQVYVVEEFMGPRLDDDPITESPRAWATYQLTMRADAAIQPAP